MGNTPKGCIQKPRRPFQAVDPSERIMTDRRPDVKVSATPKRVKRVRTSLGTGVRIRKRVELQ
jgi:hypothetical protein